MRVDLSEYGSKRDKLAYDDLDGAVGKLTIATFEVVKVTDEEGERKVPCLTFRETGEKVLYLNKTQLSYLVEQYGEESDDYIGKPCIVEKVTTTYGGKSFKKIWIAAPETWADALGTRRTRTPVARTKGGTLTKKRGR